MSKADRVRRGPVGKCSDPECGKWCYVTRADARRAAHNNHPGDKMSAYLHQGVWHYGHSERWRFERIRLDPLPISAIRQIHLTAKGLPWTTT